jgi:hypothetical protein
VWCARQTRSGIYCVLPSLKEPLLCALSSCMTFCAVFLLHFCCQVWRNPY